MERASLAPAILSTKTARTILLVLLTYFLVNVTWVFFRASEFSTAWRLITSMFGGAQNGAAVLTSIDMIKVAVVTVLLLLSHWTLRNTSILAVAGRMKWWAVSVIWALLLIAIIISQKSSDSFIYFQF